MGTSVRAHFRKAYRSRSDAELINKVEGGLQELEETIYWFELLCDAIVVASHQLEPLNKEANELAAIFVTCIKQRKRD